MKGKTYRVWAPGTLVSGGCGDEDGREGAAVCSGSWGETELHFSLQRVASSDKFVPCVSGVSIQLNVYLLSL